VKSDAEARNGWRSDCDDCAVTFPATPNGERALLAYVRSGPPDKQRAVEHGALLIPCDKHRRDRA
jgi:hypothetical protein